MSIEACLFSYPDKPNAPGIKLSCSNYLCDNAIRCSNEAIALVPVDQRMTSLESEHPYPWEAHLACSPECAAQIIWDDETDPAAWQALPFVVAFARFLVASGWFRLILPETDDGEASAMAAEFLAAIAESAARRREEGRPLTAETVDLVASVERLAAESRARDEAREARKASAA